MSLTKDEAQPSEQPNVETSPREQELVPAPDPVRKKRNMSKPTSGHVLSDNSNLLKAINVNKMNHQYIQNLQKANMTLKCKIKEMAEMGPDSVVSALDAESAVTRGDGGRWFDLETADEEVELKELGTIEQISSERLAARKDRQRRYEETKERRDKERGFYDRGRLGYRPRGQKQSQHVVAQVGVADRRIKQRQQFQQPAPPKPENEPKVWKAQSDRPRIWTAKNQPGSYQKPMPYHQRQLNRYEEEEEYYYEPPYRHYPQPYTHQPYGYYPPPEVPYYATRGVRTHFKARYSEQHPYDQPPKKSKQHHDFPPRYQKKTQKLEREPYRGKVRPAGDSDDETPAVEPTTEKIADMRPTAFIKDLSRRSQALEEEKAQHRAQKKAGTVSKLTEVGAGPPSSAVRRMEQRLTDAESAIDSEDPQKLSLLIYNHKMSDDAADAGAQVESPQKITQLTDRLEGLIQKAEAKLVAAQSLN